MLLLLVMVQKMNVDELVVLTSDQAQAVFENLQETIAEDEKIASGFLA